MIYIIFIIFSILMFALFLYTKSIEKEFGITVDSIRVDYKYKVTLLNYSLDKLEKENQENKTKINKLEKFLKIKLKTIPEETEYKRV